MQSSSEPLKIGSLARAANVGIETIRYYQRRRLLGQPPRPLSGQRLYSPDYVDRVRFIKRAQTLGFSLDEIAALLKLDSGTGHVRAREVASARLADIEAKIADLTAMHRTLSGLVRHCEHSDGRPRPIGADPAGRW